MKTLMVIAPHADDAAAFCGGTIAKRAAEGWRVVLVRVTDDARDSVGLSIEETIRRNSEELRTAAAILGIAEIVELGFPTDTLADVPETRLRERFVYLFRRHRPYAVMGFDPSPVHEPNQDHLRVAAATEEAYWVSCFDLHHPEHFEEGLAPFTPAEKWYFARQLAAPHHIEDVTDYIAAKVDAFCAHRTMVRNIINQYRLQAETWGRRIPMLDAAMEGDPRELLSMFLGGQARQAAAKAGWADGRAAELFRVERFGALDGLFEAMSEPL